MKKTISAEPQVADLGNSWLREYGLPYKLEQEPLGNSEIDNALDEYFSKNGGNGGNRPDVKLLLTDGAGNYWPILIEYKGYRDKLVKLSDDGQVENRSTKNEPLYKNINSYAVNGAVHYANAILQYTSYTNIIAVGMTGWLDEVGQLQHSIVVYHVSKENLGIGQKVGEFSDLSFLRSQNFDGFIERVKMLRLSEEELALAKNKREQEITVSLMKLNNDIYKNEKGISQQDRVYLVAASIMATLGVADKVRPLEKAELKSLTETDNRDGDIMLRKIRAFLKEKKLPDTKRDMIVRTLQNTLTADNINIPQNGESQLKRIFAKIVDDLGIYYKIGLTTDFTGKLFNEMYSWLGFSQDTLNDVVLTPAYVAKLLVKLARVNMDSYVWDFATGSAGLLVAAMNEMIQDATDKIKSPDELERKKNHIKLQQLLGTEILPDIYMLAILNMIMMGDGSSCILNEDSLNYFDLAKADGREISFPATAFVLNPPYSAGGCGMIFAERALAKMSCGYGAIIIQNSAGSGKATEFNRRILRHSTLLASIKMPVDLFIGKSSVQTNIYVFRVGEAHQKDDTVKFIDFSHDGYTRTNRKKANVNLKDTDNAAERYQEVVDLVRYGRKKLHYLSENDYYEGTIDPTDGADWNQAAPIDKQPTFSDLSSIISNYLTWKISNVLRPRTGHDALEKNLVVLAEKLKSVGWKEFAIGDLFEVNSYKKRFDANKVRLTKGKGHPYIVRQEGNNGQKGFIDEDERYLNEGNTISFGQDTATIFYQEIPYFTGDKIKILKAKHSEFNKRNAQFFLASMNAAFKGFSWGALSFGVEAIKKQKIVLPIKDNGTIDFAFMEDFVTQIEAERIAELENYLSSI